MAFLRAKDYDKQITTEDLTEVIGGDFALLLVAEQAAQAEMESYLCHRYDVDKIFVDVPVFDEAETYVEGDVVWHVDINGTFYTCLADTVAGEDPIDTPAKWQAGDTRPAQIITYLIDITLYHLHARINPRNIPELRGQRRDEAINWLKMINEGKISSKLTLLATPEKPGLSIKWESNGKFNHKY